MVRNQYISAHKCVGTLLIKVRVNGNVILNIKAQTERWNWFFGFSERTKWSSVEAIIQSSALRHWRWKLFQVISIEYETLSLWSRNPSCQWLFYDSLLCCKIISSQHFQILLLIKATKYVYLTLHVFVSQLFSYRRQKSQQSVRDPRVKVRMQCLYFCLFQFLFISICSWSWAAFS